ncbi:hypothetical protein ACQ1PF_07850 [Ornithobacterium rhinotracheale]
MAVCINKLEKDIEYNCESPSVAGIEQNVLLINREDIDWAASRATGNEVTSLVLKSTKTGYIFSGKPKHVKVVSKPVIDENGVNGYQHQLSFRVYQNTKEDYAMIDSLVKGANLVAIIERKQKGEQSKSAFEIVGWYNGLTISGDSEGLNVHENDGTYLLSFATADGEKEPKSIMKWLQTDYATTKGKFDAKLAG